MADFPASVLLSANSTMELVSNRRTVDYSEGGDYRAVDLAGSVNATYKLMIQYVLINSSDYATLTSFLETNAGFAVSIDFHDGERYTGRYMDGWTVNRVSAGTYNVEIEFYGRRQ